MSAKLNPEWADVHVVTRVNSSSAEIHCPYCGYSQFSIFEKKVKELMLPSYYSVAHIPPYVIMTCDECEKDYEVTLVGYVLPKEVRKI